MTAATTRPPQNHQATFAIPFDVAQETVTTSFTIWTGGPDRYFRLGRVFYNNPTGFAQDPSAYWTIKVTDGTNTLASWSTQTGAQGTLTANTPVNLVLATTPAPAADLAPNLALIVTLTKTGSPSALPAGRIVVDGRFL